MEIVLKKNELLDLGESLKDTTLICLAGSCWLTQSGDSRDHILLSGNLFNISRKGQLVVTATADCRLKLVAALNTVKAGSPWHPLICNN